MSSITETLASWIDFQSPTTIAVTVAAGLFAILAWSTSPDKTPDLPGPRGWPIVGSIFQRGSDPADTYHKWSKIYGPVFRMRLGNKWVVIINSAEAGDELLGSAKYGAIFQSRPMPHTLGKMLGIASKKAITLGTSPYDDLLKGKRRLSIASVSPAASKSYENIIERAAQYFVRRLDEAYKQADGGSIDPWPVFFDGASVLAITVLCGASVNEAADLLKDIPYPMKRLGQIRNIHGHWRDFFPFLRVLPNSRMFREAVAVAKYRNGKLTYLLERSRRLYEEGNPISCAAISILKENKTGLSDESLTSVINSMVSSGLDAHMPNTLLWAIGILAAYKDIQKKCYEAILQQDALGEGVEFTKDNYLLAFIKEIGRYVTTFRMALARETIGQDLVWRGHFIPEGTTVWYNTHAMNRDETHFSMPDKFMPERYISGPEAERSMPHYGFGVGRRNCPAMNLVHKEIYTVLKHVLLNFELDIDDGEREFHAIRGCADGLEFNQAPKPFRLSLSIRDQDKLQAYLKAEL